MKKSEGNQKSVEIPQTTPAYRRNQWPRVIPTTGAANLSMSGAHKNADVGEGVFDETSSETASAVDDSTPALKQTLSSAPTSNQPTLPRYAIK